MINVYQLPYILIDEAVKRLGIEKNITIYTIPLNDTIYIIFFLQIVRMT